MPIHTGTLVMMGVHLIDNADLEALAEKCARDGRYDFMFSLLPLVLERGTALPRESDCIILTAALDAIAAPMSEPTTGADIVMLDAIELSHAIKSGQVSCVEVMNAYLDHIDRLNPHVNAIVSLQPRADLLNQARQRDQQLAHGDYLGWMHGFPQAIKDLEPVAGIRTTMGSPLLKDFVPAADSILVERMKAAGSIIIGKTNVPEFGLGSQTYNTVFGTTLNAYDQSKTSGGSSGGAAVSLALRMLPVADGSDHGGSLRNPAAFNNVFGFRTSFGRVPASYNDVSCRRFPCTARWRGP